MHARVVGPLGALAELLGRRGIREVLKLRRGWSLVCAEQIGELLKDPVDLVDGLEGNHGRRGRVAVLPKLGVEVLRHQRSGESSADPHAKEPGPAWDLLEPRQGFDARPHVVVLPVRDEEHVNLVGGAVLKKQLVNGLERWGDAGAAPHPMEGIDISRLPDVVGESDEVIGCIRARVLPLQSNAPVVDGTREAAHGVRVVYHDDDHAVLVCPLDGRRAHARGV